MTEDIYRIKLSDGRFIENLKLGGNNFISGSILTRDIFEFNLSPVEIIGPSGSVIHESMELSQLAVCGLQTAFILNDISKSDLERSQMKADIEYIAMMGGIDL